MNTGKSSQLGKHGLGSLHNLTWACYHNEDTCFNIEFASHSQTRKHSIRMRTTRLETYAFQFWWPLPDVARGRGGFSKWTSLNRSPVITTKCHNVITGGALAGLMSGGFPGLIQGVPTLPCNPLPVNRQTLVKTLPSRKDIWGRQWSWPNLLYSFPK